MLKNLLTTYDSISVGTPNVVGRLAEDSPMHPPPKTKYSLARNKCISRGHQIRPRGKNGRNSFHRMRMKMPRLGGSYVAAGAFSFLGLGRLGQTSLVSKGVYGQLMKIE